MEGKDNKTLKLKGGSQIGFDKLVLAAGSIPIKPAIPGIENDNIYILSMIINLQPTLSASFFKILNISLGFPSNTLPLLIFVYKRFSKICFY